jgi:tetratricopeptide (TPR) repeat protein
MNKNIKKALVLYLVLSQITVSWVSAFSKDAYQFYIRGQIAGRAGDLERAIQEYENVLKIDSKAVKVYRELTSLYWQTGNTIKALDAAEKLEELSGKDVGTKLFLGNFYLVSGNTDKARELWEKVLEIEPDNETAILYLAAYYSERNIPQAISYWKMFLEKKPDSAPGYFQLGASQEKMGQYDNAVESYKKAISIAPGSAEMHIALAGLYEKQENFKDAIIEYNKYIELAPKSVNVLLYLGGLYYRLKMFDEAQGVFEKALKTNHDDISIYFWLGIMAEQKRDWASAIKYFEHIRAKEETPAVLSRLSFYYSSQKNVSQALKYLKKAVKIDPSNPNSYFLLGLAYFDLEKYKKAEGMFLKAIELKPNFDDAYFHLGAVYDSWKKFDKAEAMMQKAIDMDPKNSTAMNYLGYSYVERNINLDRAEALISKALVIDPDNGAYIDSLGWIYFKKGEYEKSEKYLLEASSKLSDPVVWEHLGDVSLKLNKTSEAWDAYQKALNIEPKNKVTLKKIKELEKFVLPRTLQRKILYRAIGNLTQITSLKSNFSISGKSKGKNFYSFGVFQYKRPSKWRIDILGNFLTPHVIVVENNGLKIYPEALNNNSDILNTEHLNRLKTYLNAGILKSLDSEKTIITKNGTHYIYKLEEKTLEIDAKDGTITNYSDSGKITVNFRKQVHYEGLYLPLEAEIYLPDKDMFVQIKVRDFGINKTMEDEVFTTPVIQQGENK